MSYTQLNKYIYFGLHPSIVFPEPFKNNNNSVFINLTEKHEFPNYSQSDREIHNFPTKDRTPPSSEYITKIINIIFDSINNGKLVYIFCKGGHGRSGTIASILYGIINGLDGTESMKNVLKLWKTQRDMSKLRHNVKKLGCPQTRAQKDTVIYFLENVADVFIRKAILYHKRRVDELEQEIQMIKLGKAPRKVEVVKLEEADKKPCGTINKILFYEPKKPYYEFSNFYPVDIEYDDKIYPTAEHLFQSMKFLGENANERSKEYAEIIRTQNTANKAFILARQVKKGGYKWRSNLNEIIEKYKDVKMREDWDKERLRIMKDILLLKFKNKKLKDMLLKTGDKHIIEDSPRDSFWGIGKDKKGENNLGKILMEIREKLTIE